MVNYTVTLTDNCPGSSSTQTGGLPTGSAFPVGVTTNTFAGVDASGNTAFCSFTVTVNDTQLPTITCPANISVSNDPNQCFAVVNYPGVTFGDNCSGATIPQTTGLASGSQFPIGTTTNTYKVTDASGNMTTCAFTVMVGDTQLPVFTVCPADATVSNNPGVCGALVNYTVTVTDNCVGFLQPKRQAFPAAVHSRSARR